MRAYEGLFLVDEGRATETWQEVSDHIRGLLERRGAKIQKLDKWDSCRLAYEIDGKKRGTYVLSHFEANPAEIAELRRDCELSTVVMRSMILRMENVGESLEAAEAAQRAKRRAEGLPEEPAAAEAAAPGMAPGDDADSDIIGNAGDLEEGTN